MYHRWLALFILVLLVACAPPAPQGSSIPIEDLFRDAVDVVDLTHALSPSSSYWPSPEGNPFQHEIVRAHESGAAAMAAYATPEHHGTHLDAPIHSKDGQPSVDELTAADLFGPAVVIDVAAKCLEDPDYALAVDDILDWERAHGPMPEGAIALMGTGWSLKYDDQSAYANEMHFPGFSEEAARFLVESRDIRGIGVDTLSVDPGTAEGYPVHGIVNGAGKYHLENVANVHQLPESGAYLIVAPIKIEGGSGGQVRIFAVIP